MNKESIISKYLDDQDLAYKAWYSKKLEVETGMAEGEPVGLIKDYQKIFESWVKDNRSKLADRICPKQELIKRTTETVEVVVVIADLITTLPIVTGVYETSALLFRYGISKLCSDYEA